MQLITSPSSYINTAQTNSTVFLAGGISNCPNWQKDLANILKDVNVVLFNPRRDDFDIRDDAVSKVQIEWEYSYLKRASAISFWFPSESDCPITLFELGAWAATRKPIFVGVHAQYRRRLDVRTQLSLARPEVSIVGSITELSNQIKSWVKLHG